MPIPLISKIKPQNNGAFPMYDDIDGYGGFQVRLNATDRNGIPALNRKFGMLVYTQVENTFWQLASDLVTWNAILQSPVVPNASWNQASWFIDPVSGNNLNDGLTSVTAIKTWAELIRRWGTFSPVITLSVTITFLSDQPDTSDPISLSPYLVGSGTIAITGTLHDVGDGYLASVVSKNYNATGNYPNGLLQADLGGAASGHQGYLLVNHTQGGAVCWIDSLSGTVATLTQPFVSDVPAYLDGPDEVNTFTTGDAFSVFKPTKVYAENVEVAATYNAAINLSHLWLIDASGTPGTTFLSLSHSVRCTEIRVDCSIVYVDNIISFNNQVQNSWVGGSGTFATCFIVGGSFGTLIQFSGGSDFSGVLDGDVIIRGSNIITSGTGFSENFLGAIYIDNSTALSFINETQITADTVFAPSNAYDGYVYGKYVLDLRDVSCKVTYNPLHGTGAAEVFKGQPTLQINATSFANAYDTSLDPAVWHPGRALTVANLDTPVSQGGFGGLAIGDGGAIFTRGVQAGAPVNYQQQNAWFIDPQNGSDLSDGLTSLTPIKTWAELTRRWGTVSPILAQSTTITFLSSQTDGSDPIIFTPFIRAGAEVQILGVLNSGNQVSSGTISSTVARDRVTGQLYQTTLADTPSAGWLVHFIDNDSYSWVYKTPGGHVATLSQPTFSSDYIFGGPGLPTDPITGQFIQAVILDGYSYVAYTPVQVNFVQIATQPVADFGAGSGFNLVVRKITGFDPSNPPPFFGINDISAGQITSFFESAQQKTFDQELTSFTFLHNCWMMGGVFLNFSSVHGGIISGGSNDFMTFRSEVDLENDVILNNNTTGSSNVFAIFSGADTSIGLIYIDGYVSLGIHGEVNTIGTPGYVGGTVVWGPGTLNVVSGFFNYTPPAVQTFLSHLEINSLTVASAYDVTGIVGVWRDNILLDGYHLDLSVSQGGFGGTAIIPGAGTITNRSNFQTVSALTTLFVDPSNVTGLANDNNNGQTDTTPILTTGKLNAILAFQKLANNVTVTYMSDDVSTDALDLSTVILGGFSLTFQGTPQLVHSGGTLNAGTIAMNPLAPGGGQRQVVHTSDLADFNPYAFANGAIPGGTSTYPNFLVDNVTGATSWIVRAGSPLSDGYMSRPCDSNGNLSHLHIGDTYKIQRGSLLRLAKFEPPTSVPDAGGFCFFNDFTFTTDTIGSNNIAIYTRCAFPASLTIGGGFVNCFFGAGILQGYPMGAVVVTAGVIITLDDQSLAPVEFSADVYVTGFGIILGQDFYSSLFITPGDGYGVQLQDCKGVGGAFIVFDVAEVGFFGIQQAHSLIWGNGNIGLGMGVFPGATVMLPEDTIPSVTGALGDFGFFGTNSLNSGVTTLARSWNEVGNKYNDPAPTTWANFANPNVFNFQAHNVTTQSTILAISNEPTPVSGPQGSARQAMGPVRFIDPSNVTGFADDNNDGSTITNPILTTAHLNDLLFNRHLTADIIITYLSDDTGIVGLDFSTMDLETFNLTFQGTPTILHTGGTINAGTIAIDPAANQKQIIHTSDLSTWDGYIFTGLGGSATRPALLLDTTTNDSAWIVNSTGGADGYASRPLTFASVSLPTAGSLTIGHGYKIQRGTLINVANGQPPLQSSGSQSTTNGLAIFNDFTLGATTFGTTNCVYNRCAFINVVNVGGSLYNCYVSAGFSGIGSGNIFMRGGVLIASPSDFLEEMNMDGDTYVTGTGWVLGPNNYVNVFVSSQVGSGVQVQDMFILPSGLSGIIIAANVNFANQGLYWGSGNHHAGIAVLPGCTLIVPRGTGNILLTGTVEDFVFVSSTGTFSAVARAFDSATGVFTQAGNPATLITSWANLLAAIGSDASPTGFNFNAQLPETNAAVVAT